MVPRRNSPVDEFSVLKELGLKACKIMGDGNCLFRALSDQIYGDDSHAKEIRATVVNYMRKHASDFSPFIPVDGERRAPKRKHAATFSADTTAATDQAIEQNFENYLQKMAKNGIWGGHLEIQAFSKAFCMSVVVFNSVNAFKNRFDADNSRGTAYLALHSFEHYSSVRNIAGPDTGLPNIKLGDEPEVSDSSSASSSPTSSASSAPTTPEPETPTKKPKLGHPGQTSGVLSPPADLVPKVQDRASELKAVKVGGTASKKARPEERKKKERGSCGVGGGKILGPKKEEEKLRKRRLISRAERDRLLDLRA